jgi:hypothetical protein
MTTPQHARRTRRPGPIARLRQWWSYDPVAERLARQRAAAEVEHAAWCERAVADWDDAVERLLAASPIPRAPVVVEPKRGPRVVRPLTLVHPPSAGAVASPPAALPLPHPPLSAADAWDRAMRAPLLDDEPIWTELRRAAA